MKLLQKILLIVMICIVAGNVDVNAMATVLDFDTIVAVGTNIPDSFQPKWNDTAINANPHGVRAPNGIYVYFTVIPNAEGAVANVYFAQLNTHAQHPAVAAAVPTAGDHNIYFPADGSQPTTADIVAWSCATVNDHRITEWYMQMFGVPIAAIDAGLAIPHAAVQAGFNNAIQPAAIIAFDALVNNVNMVNDPDHPTTQISRINLFIQNFYKIASTSVGRVLLYRILIEIRRHDCTNKGICEDNQNSAIIQHIRNIADPVFNLNMLITVAPNYFDQRNACRCLNVLWAQPFGFVRQPATLNFNDTVTNKQIATHLINTNNTHINGQASILDEDLFHELLHWYHWLRDSYRFALDINASNISLQIDDVGRIGGVYYNNLHGININERRLLTVAWCTRRVTGSADFVANFEEMRTILGSPNNIPHYLEGDDLSENVFILFKKSIMQGQQFSQIRFGHKDLSYIELAGPVNLAITVANQALNNYVPQHVAFLPFFNMTDGVDIYDYMTILGWNGARYQKPVANIASQVKP
jgi:hypothetical protein